MAGFMRFFRCASIIHDNTPGLVESAKEAWFVKFLGGCVSVTVTHTDTGLFMSGAHTQFVDLCE